jgi:excisionase family DNA binding protein
MQDELLTIDEAAEYLRVGKRTIYNWIYRGKIKPIKLGGIKFQQNYLDELIRKSQKS